MNGPRPSVSPGVRMRRKADGSTVYDAYGGITTGDRRGNKVHLGTYPSLSEAEDVVECWRISLEWDHAIRRERSQRCFGSTVRSHYEVTSGRIGPGGEYRHRDTNVLQWLDPVGDQVADRVDAERQALANRRYFERPA